MQGLPPAASPCRRVSLIVFNIVSRVLASLVSHDLRSLPWIVSQVKGKWLSKLHGDSVPTSGTQTANKCRGVSTFLEKAIIRLVMQDVCHWRIRLRGDKCPSSMKRRFMGTLSPCLASFLEGRLEKHWSNFPCPRDFDSMPSAGRWDRFIVGRGNSWSSKK